MSRKPSTISGDHGSSISAISSALNPPARALRR
jgi:hypothetical protein